MSITNNLLIKDEKHTANAVAYAIELINPAKVTGEEPEIKKRLEAEVQPHITIEQI